MDGFEEYTCPYSPAQVKRYLERVKLPDDLCTQLLSRDPGQSVGQGTSGLVLLTQLQVCHLSTIPFESLSLHYAKEPYVSVDPQHIFEKLVLRDRGGYCMEQNALFYHMLRAFGFPVFNTGARVRTRVAGRPQGLFSGLLVSPSFSELEETNQLKSLGHTWST